MGVRVCRARSRHRCRVGGGTTRGGWCGSCSPCLDGLGSLPPLCPSSPPHNPRIKSKTTTHINEKFKTMSKRHTDSTPDEKAPKRRKLSGSVLVEAARNGDTTAVEVGLEKLIPDTDSKTVSFDAVHEACRGNHDECLALLLPYVETTQMGFGMLLSECVHADHTASLRCSLLPGVICG